MSKILLLHKPFQVLSCFTDTEGRQTLADFIQTPNIYAAGRLDYDSEGLLLLTDEGALQHRLANPAFKLPKTYWVQVEGEISSEALQALRQGVMLKDGPTRPAKARAIPAPPLAERNPPIRQRAHIKTSWLELVITEGRNRQVRRMTAAVGFPTLRLVRYAIGPWTLANLAVGEQRWQDVHLPETSTQKAKSSRRLKTGKRAPVKR
ncbi:pseudouridine synthase [Nitrincola tapanii]|uniref:Pseudouridine synthase n=1 Tax=Nitrincola tapanii TaxID=1708751 RepID=A0A5A9W5M1_9GAMM|nr:pseudouridine synthase [Nitrincola tapanii]KAA0875388.1 pseudouridine synthase [Nitrincola tapanii]